MNKILFNIYQIHLWLSGLLLCVFFGLQFVDRFSPMKDIFLFGAIILNSVFSFVYLKKYKALYDSLK